MSSWLYCGRRVVRGADVVDPRADGVRGAEVERRARDRNVVAERDLGGVRRRVLVRVHLNVLAVGRARGRGLAGQVEVAVVGLVDDRVQVRGLVGRLVVDGQLAGVVQGVGHDRLELRRVAGAAVRAAGRTGRVALVAIRADQRELHARGALAVHGLRRPDVVAPADQAAVQRVAVVVDRQGVRDGPDTRLVQGERALGDAVAVPADRLAEVRAAVRDDGRAVELDVVGERLEAEHDVGLAAGAARHADRLDDAAVGEDLDGHPPAVAEGVAVDVRVLPRVWLNRLAEELAADARAAVPPRGPGGRRGGGGRTKGSRGRRDRGDGGHRGDPGTPPESPVSRFVRQ